MSVFSFIKALPDIIYYGHSDKGDVPPEDACDGSHYTDCSTGLSYHRENGAWHLASSGVTPVNTLMLTMTNTNPAESVGYGTWILKGQSRLLMEGSGPLTIYVWERTS